MSLGKNLYGKRFEESLAIDTSKGKELVVTVTLQLKEQHNSIIIEFYTEEQ